MSNKILDFFDSLKGKKVGVIGLGVSHDDLMSLMVKKGIDITLIDKRSPFAIGDHYRTLEKLGVHFCLGDEYLNSLTDYDVIFRTPGMYFLKDELTKARENGVIVTSEMEVFLDLCPCKVFAITGSDGKTTTSTLISEMFKQSGKTVHLGGNIGRALLPIIEDIKSDDICVVELSSFQLISMRQAPDVAVITNIEPNHLDVHKDMQEYIDCKINIIAHQNAFSKTVLNLDNKLCSDLAPLVRGRLSYFSRQNIPQHGTYLDENGNLCRVKHGKTRILFNKEEIMLPGIHNVENYLTAIAAIDDEVSDEDILKVAREFGGVEHRIEYVRTVDGVKYYNDSIASSPTRTIAGLNAFKQKLIIIAGGYDKKIPYEPLAPVLIKRAKILILLGKTGPKIEAAVKSCEGYEESGLKIFYADDLEDAVDIARKMAVEGDVVSLSPASASFDLYKNFEQRGHHFKNIIYNLK